MYVKPRYLINARHVLANYTPYFVGRSGNALDQEQKRAMAIIMAACTFRGLSENIRESRNLLLLLTEWKLYETN